MFPCRVAGCSRMLRSSVGESRHFNASHCRDLPPVNPTAVPVNTRCIETDDDRPLQRGQDDDDLMLGDQDAATSHPTGSSGGHVWAVGTVEALPLDVFLVWGVVVLSHGTEMVSDTSSFMPVLLAAGG